VLTSLNHPNIGAIYGLEESCPVPALVLELIEGATLTDRIARGPLPCAEALSITRQIADALDAAHEQTVIHGDLKPAKCRRAPPSPSARRGSCSKDATTAAPRCGPDYDVDSQGQRFLMIKEDSWVSAPAEIRVVMNWLDDLKQRVPTQ
jgi:protein kinase-like protein